MLKVFSAILVVGFSCPTAHASEMNLVSQFAEGGVALVIILFLSILVLSVSAERLVNFREKNIFPRHLMTEIKPLWLSGEFQRIHHLLVKQHSVLAHTLDFMVINRHQSFEFISRGAAEIASLELRKHQQKFYALAIVATVAPIVGLLGTVIGMIEAFHIIAYSQGMGNPALLAGGISKALINTAAGLSVALPALAMHHFFKYRTAVFGLFLEQEINQLANQWFSTSSDVQPSAPSFVDEMPEVSYAD